MGVYLPTILGQHPLFKSTQNIVQRDSISCPLLSVLYGTSLTEREKVKKLVSKWIIVSFLIFMIPYEELADFFFANQKIVRWKSLSLGLYTKSEHLLSLALPSCKPIKKKTHAFLHTCMFHRLREKRGLRKWVWGLSVRERTEMRLFMGIKL